MPVRQDPIRLSPSERLQLYAAKGYLGLDVETKTGLTFTLDAYVQDPLVAAERPQIAFDSVVVGWEPGLADGPTSARFAVVDYHGDTEMLTAPARWNGAERNFTNDAGVVDRGDPESFQFHQVHAWAVAQRALEFYESALGRRIPWGFEGNRLIIVPHAGYGENAYYDRESKSLQFYFFERGGRRIYTCLSTDIIHHEFGHAVLDGIRPHLHESVGVETAAFHEFVGDLTAVLILLRNNDFRRRLSNVTNGDLSEADALANVAEQFGREVAGKEYLRTARNELTMGEVRASASPHHVSQVLTGAMFDIVLDLSRHYVQQRNRTAAQAFWDTIQRMQRTALQPLDLLPPVDVTFEDYALAVLRMEQLSNPTDPFGYRQRMIDAFVARGILDDATGEELQRAQYLYERLDWDVPYSVASIARSRASAYRFLDDNRRALYIPPNRDVLVTDLYDAQKVTRQAQRLPRQTVLIYLWREDIELAGKRFGAYAGRLTSMLCGGTLVLDEGGSVQSWCRKPGTDRCTGPDWQDELGAGEVRRARFLADVERLVAQGRLGRRMGSSFGLLGSRIPPVTSSFTPDGRVRFEMTPHMSLTDDESGTRVGGRTWEISS